MTLEEAKKIIKSECYIADLLNLDRTQMVNTALDTVIEAAEEKPQRAKGHLVSNQQDGEVKPFWERYRCSICGEYAQDNFNYCSRCGAELEGDEE